jgi:hypothetical protein
MRSKYTMVAWAVVSDLVDVIIETESHELGQSAQETGLQEKSNWFWNVGVMLALPIVTLAWYVPFSNHFVHEPISSRSMIIFMVAIIWFLWRSSATTDTLTLNAPPRTELGFRIVLCIFFVIAMVYLVLAVTKPFHYSIKDHPRLRTRIAQLNSQIKHADAEKSRA